MSPRQIPGLVPLLASLLLASCGTAQPTARPPAETAGPDYLNTALPFRARVADLVDRMTPVEKIAQLSHLAPAIERLGVRAYEPGFNNPYAGGKNMFVPGEVYARFAEEKPWRSPASWDAFAGRTGCLDGGYWGEALHGLARSGLATVFPQAIGLASSWNPELLERVTTAISDEALVHHKVYGKPLVFWSPTINMLRDPRWGRTEEAYSEDPYLQSRMAVAFVRGLQGDHPKYLKTVATPKHFVANNSEFNRHFGNSVVPERQLREYYFPAYKAAIQEGGASSVMAAYNAVNGIPVSANRRLLTDVLRREWGFDGFVVSDCGAISDIPHQHKYETDRERAVALAVKAGLEIECETCETEQMLYDRYLPGALEKGYLTEADLDTAVSRVFLARFRLGEFDPPEMNPYSQIDESKLDSREHRELSLEAARQSMVLLRNEGGLLPLSKDQRVAVVGPYADQIELGAYSGTPSFTITPVEGVRAAVGPANTYFAEGVTPTAALPGSIARAVAMARAADVAVVVLGTNQQIASEHQDRDDLAVPAAQQELLEAVRAANPNTVLVLMSGIPLAVNWAQDNVPAILEAWFPGQAGGQAIAEVLFGDVNPAGRLPVTFYRGVDDLPALDDYDIEKGRTYWYYEGDNVLYPFGYGLSYTEFSYGDLRLPQTARLSDATDQITVELTVQNRGSRDGDEVVQLYVRDPESALKQPRRKLRRFARVSIPAGQSRTVSFELDRADFAYWNETKNDWDIEPGAFEVMVGASSEDIRQRRTLTVE